MEFEVVMRHLPPEGFFKRKVLLEILTSYKRPVDKINDWVRQNKLVRISNGYYIPGRHYQTYDANMYVLANSLRNKSYISMLSALFLWKMVNDDGECVSSMTTAHSKKIQTLIGCFTYKFLPLRYYSVGITTKTVGQDTSILIACPEKAISDLLLIRKGLPFKKWTDAQRWLRDDIHLARVDIWTLNVELMKKWFFYSKKKNDFKFLFEALKKI